MPDHTIICPYCFKSFDDKDVCFRMETIFKDIELDPTNSGLSRDDLENNLMLNESEENQRILDLYDLRSKFQVGTDPVYEEFWRRYGGIKTEVSSDAADGNSKTIKPFERPVYSPSNREHNAYFSKTTDRIEVQDGIVVGAVDCFGVKTKRRVCPHCHNPLPGNYGIYPVLFIPIIGVTGSGKTVYLSQLCCYIRSVLSRYSISVNPTSQYSIDYPRLYPVKIGSKLPQGTAPGMLLQPLCFDVHYLDNNNIKHNHTLVFYDIAGENCVDQNRFEWGPFISNSHAIIFVIDPNQFRMDTEDKNEPALVLNTIYNALGTKLEKIPFAVCVSKGDIAAREIIGDDLTEIVQVRNANGDALPKFNAGDYNKIHDEMYRFVSNTDMVLHNELKTNYQNYNYFLFSALGCGVNETKDDDGTKRYLPAGVPVPKRLMEPLLWILEEYKYITADGIIHEPTDWKCPVCGKRLKREVMYCSTCHVNKDCFWHCNKCNTDIKFVKDSKNYCPKCKRDPNGNKKSIFSF